MSNDFGNRVNDEINDDFVNKKFNDKYDDIGVDFGDGIGDIGCSSGNPDGEFNDLFKSFFDDPILFSPNNEVSCNKQDSLTIGLSSPTQSNFLYSDDSGSCMTLAASSSTNSEEKIKNDSIVGASKVNNKEDKTEGNNNNGENKDKSHWIEFSMAQNKYKSGNVKEERERLVQENERLRNDIIKLRSKLQSFPSRHDVDFIENELLRKNLSEHKKFIQQCLGISLPSERIALQSVARQGAEFSLNHVLNVVASSQNGRDWKKVNLSTFNFCSLLPEENVTMSYRIKIDEKGRKMVDLRADFVFPKINADDTTEAIWTVSSNIENLLKIFGSANPCEFLCKFEENEDEFNNHNDENNCYESSEFHIYREHRQNSMSPLDFAIVSSKTTRALAVSTLLSRPEHTPLSAIIRDQFTPKVHGQEIYSRRYSRRVPSSSKNRSLRDLVGDVNCHMLVRAATQYTSSGPLNGGLGPISHWIQAHLMVGILSWSDEAQVETSSPVIDEKGNRKFQLKKESVPATRTVAIISFFDENFKVQTFNGFSSLILESGDITPQFGMMIEIAVQLVSLQLKRIWKQRKLGLFVTAENNCQSKSKRQKTDSLDNSMSSSSNGKSASIL